MGHPAWSPDGRWIAFAGRRVGHDGIYAIRPDALGFHRFGAGVARPDEDLSWLPDGSGVVFEGRTRACPRIGVFVARVDGRGTKRLTNGCA
jgi:Tol biopolymer transport system component